VRLNFAQSQFHVALSRSRILQYLIPPQEHILNRLPSSASALACSTRTESH
jgi:hypothetical protein